MLRLIEDERHLCALSLYESIQERLAKSVESPSHPHKFRFGRSASTKLRLEETKDVEQAKELLNSNTKIIKKLVVSLP